jgi:DNA gyrase/topoisomerase IV subunit B
MGKNRYMEIMGAARKKETIMEKTMVEYSQGLLKILTVLTNTTDHSFRDITVKSIKVEYSQTGEISVWNDSTGILLKLHRTYVTVN